MFGDYSRYEMIENFDDLRRNKWYLEDLISNTAVIYYISFLPFAASA